MSVNIGDDGRNERKMVVRDHTAPTGEAGARRQACGGVFAVVPD